MPKTLPIADIRRDIACQPREALNTDVVESYAEAMKGGADFPPVVIFTDSKSVHWLADGYHRVSAAESAGFDQIAVEQRFGERRAAILYSLGANAAHGLRRSNEDKRRAVDKMLADREWATWSDHRIAEHCGVSVAFIGLRRKIAEKETTVKREQLKRRGKDGKLRPLPTITRTRENAQDEGYAEPARQVDEDITESPATTPLRAEDAVPAEAAALPDATSSVTANTADDGPQPVVTDHHKGEDSDGLTPAIVPVAITPDDAKDMLEHAFDRLDWLLTAGFTGQQLALMYEGNLTPSRVDDIAILADDFANEFRRIEETGAAEEAAA